MKKNLGNTRANQFYQEDITSESKSMTTLKTKIKSAIGADQSKAWLDHLKKRVVQGDLLKLAHSEESDLTWRSAIYSLPRRVLSFAINASIDTLPTFRNLKLCELFESVQMVSSRNTCSNARDDLYVPRARTQLFQSTLTISGANIWNKLSTAIISCNSVADFKCAYMREICHLHFLS